MGQYYKPVSIEKKEWTYSHDYKRKFVRDDGEVMYLGQGLKLMEHSYIGNPLMNAVENALVPNGKWHKTRIVWAGDYADPEPFYDATDKDENLYDLIDDKGKKVKFSTRRVNKAFHFLVNWDKEVYIDLDTITKDKDGYTIHPLSLLTAEGNGRGGGDFIGTDERIGSWARNTISLEDKAPENFKLIDGNFKEDRE